MIDLRSARAALLGATLALLVAACSQGAAPASGDAGAASGVPGQSSGQKASVIPVILSSQQVVGPNRFVFSFLDPATNQPAASPDRTASVAFIPPGATQPGAPAKADFVWAIEGSRGVYVTHADFSQPGDWKAVFITQPAGGKQESIGFDFQVLDKPVTVAVGDKAPASDTPTLASVGGDVAKISTDPKPDPAFYQLSVKDALAQHKPFVLVFATPGFCKSAQCGPTLDVVKQAAADAPSDVAFINVEPYKLAYTEGRLQPVLDANGQLQTVPAADEWKIVQEPWIFTVDSTGTVRGSFEGVVGKQELADAVKAISGS